MHSTVPLISPKCPFQIQYICPTVVTVDRVPHFPYSSTLCFSTAALWAPNGCTASPIPMSKYSIYSSMLLGRCSTISIFICLSMLAFVSVLLITILEGLTIIFVTVISVRILISEIEYLSLVLCFLIRECVTLLTVFIFINVSFSTYLLLYLRNS